MEKGQGIPDTLIGRVLNLKGSDNDSELRSYEEEPQRHTLIGKES